MRSNRKILFGLLLIVGAFAFYKAFRALSSLGSSPRPVSVANGASPSDPNAQTVSAKTPSGRIAFAATNIPANSIITPDMLVMKPSSYPSDQGYVTNIETQAAGFITRRDIPSGSAIRPADDLVGHLTETGIAGLLRPGTRAMMVPVPNKPTLHDLVRIGNFVDVLAAFDGQESRSIVQNARVLGVDMSANDYPNVNAAMRGPFKAAPRGVATEAAAAPTPTPTPSPNNAGAPSPALVLEVTPAQAARIQLAIATGASLDFIVRPALPGNRPADITPVTGPDGTTIGQSSGGDLPIQNVSVTRPQLAPYASGHRAPSPAPGKSVLASSGGGEEAPRRGVRRPLENAEPPFPPIGNSSTTVKPAQVSEPGNSAPPAPVAPVQQSYSIPVYGDGKILRTETVPLPAS